MKKLALLSCGLGNVERGFEVSTARWYEALKDVPDVDAHLYAGGKYPGATTCWNIDRTNFTKYVLRLLPGLDPAAGFKFAYGIEQVSFAFGFFPYLLKFQPDIVWTKEAPLAHLVDMFRFDLRLPYRIIFANGGAFHPATYARFDFIQHLQSESYREAVEWGIPASKMKLLSNLIPPVQISESKKDLRQRWGYTEQDWIVICVAAWNKHHKRIDYLINEFAKFVESAKSVEFATSLESAKRSDSVSGHLESSNKRNNSNLKLLLCGHADIETAELKALAQAKLPHAARWLTLQPDDVRRAMAMSDVLVLPTIEECFGNVLIEAALQGLPIITHPHPGALQLTNDRQWLADLSAPGNLAQRLAQLYAHPPSPEILNALKQRAVELTDNNKMIMEFRQMLEDTMHITPGITQL